MVKSYFKVTFITYIIMFITAFLINMGVEVKAEEDLASTDKIYYLEMNAADYTDIKADILSKDVKYVAYPKMLAHDISLSEVNASDINHKTHDVQTVEIAVSRFTDSNAQKQKIDIVSEVVKIQFIDTTPPTIKLSENSIEFEEGKSFNPKDYIKEISDNSFDEVLLDIDSNVDNNKPGKYEVVFTAVDASNNEASKTLAVNVLEKPKPAPKPVVVAPVVKTVSAPASGSNVATTLSLINQHRANAGLAPLALGSSAHMQAAQTRAIEAASYVSHSRPDGRNFKTAFTDLGLNNANVIEVLTYSGSTPAAKVAWWMSSPTHRAVLMRSDITHIAIGISGGMYAGIVYR